MVRELGVSSSVSFYSCARAHFNTFTQTYQRENRYVNDIGNDCLASVDGTDFQMGWGAKYKRFCCHKFYKKPGLRYEVAVCLRTSDIVWISGPHFPGLHNDIEIFRMGLIHILDDGERMEADMGYRGEHPVYIKMHSKKFQVQLSNEKYLVKVYNYGKTKN